MKKSARANAARRTRTTFGARLIKSMRQAVAIERGELKPGLVRRYPITARQAAAMPAPNLSADDVRTIRDRLDLSQPVFASALNVSAETVKAWEQGKKRPSGPAARLLQIVELHPSVLNNTLRPVGSDSRPNRGRSSNVAQLARGTAARPASRRNRAR
jgi:putative transcriptional regulator